MTHNERREHSPSASVSVIEHSKLLPWLMLAAILAGLSTGISALTLVLYGSSYRELEREYRLLQMQTDNMKVALLANGIDPAPHLKGETP